VQAFRIAPCHADAARPLGRPGDRNLRREWPAAADDYRGDATARQLRFEAPPSAAAVRAAIEVQVPDDGWFDDVNGSPAYKRHVTVYFAEQIRAELAKARREIGIVMKTTINGKLLSVDPDAASACVFSCANTAASASRKAATKAIAAPVRCGWTAHRSIAA
jgi:hypothetical protein